jgi:hypothetical protein
MHLYLGKSCLSGAWHPRGPLGPAVAEQGPLGKPPARNMVVEKALYYYIIYISNKKKRRMNGQ